jgi:hypothetical protein
VLLTRENDSGVRGQPDRRIALPIFDGRTAPQSNTLSDSPHPTLEAIEHVKDGFNISRRFRIAHLQKKDCPEVLRHFWSGHAPRHVSERYTKLREERDFRLEWTEKIGLGFELPPSIGQLGQLRIVPKVA